MIRVLNIIGSMGRGGAETFLMNVYRNIDREKLQFDFLLYDIKKSEGYIDEIRSMGGRIYELPPKKKAFFRGLLQIKKIVKEEKYDIVWRHINSPFKAIDLIMARLGGATHTVLHSHNASVKGGEKLLGKISRFFFLPFVTVRYACGEAAGRWMFGKRKFQIIRNGIDIEKFIFNEKVRREYRKKFNIDEKLVIGHVGRFEEVKNHKFLLQILEQMRRSNKDTVLVLVGDGTLRTEIEAESKVRGLSEYIHFLGVRTDIENLMQMFDVFVMPSYYEGFPVVLLEAQAADLPCVISDTISKEVKILDTLCFVNLLEEPEEWEKEIVRALKNEREDVSSKIKEAGFDIKRIALELQTKFCSM